MNMRIAQYLAIGCHHQVILEYRQHRANMSADCAHMLRSAVSVRRAQRRYVRKDRAREQAWRAGLEIVRADFGDRLIEQIKDDLHATGRRGKALRALVCLLRYYPAGVVKRATAAARRLTTMAR